MESNFSKVKVFIYLLFVFSGLIKWLPGLVLDPTLFFGVISTGILLLDLKKIKIYKDFRVYVILLCMLSFVAWCLISVSYSASVDFWKQKVSSLFLSTIIFLFPLISLRSEKEYHYLIKGLFYAGLFTAIGVLILYLTGLLGLIIATREEKTLIPDYLVLGEMLGIGMLVSLFRIKALRIAALIFCFLMLILLAARGPFIFAVLILIMYVFMKAKIRFFSLKAFLLTAIFVGILFWLFSQWEETALLLARLSVNLSDDTSSLERLDAYRIAWNAFIENPVLGIGFAGFGYYGWQLDENIYPHNIFLEIAAETGIVGLLLFVSGVITFFAVVSKWLQNPVMQLFFCIFLFIFFNYLKSGGLIDARKMLFMMGVTFAFANLQILKSKNLIKC